MIVLKTVELYTFQGYIAWYANYINKKNFWGEQEILIEMCISEPFPGFTKSLLWGYSLEIC